MTEVDLLNLFNFTNDILGLIVYQTEIRTIAVWRQVCEKYRTFFLDDNYRQILINRATLTGFKVDKFTFSQLELFCQIDEMQLPRNFIQTKIETNNHSLFLNNNGKMQLYKKSISDGSTEMIFIKDKVSAVEYFNESFLYLVRGKNIL